jgi:hypothetical protein
MEPMNDHRALVLTAEITITDGHIDGTVRASGRPGHAFSGWSELFGVLTRLVGEADGRPQDGPEAQARGSI